MKYLFVLALLVLLVYAPNVCGDLLNIYEQSSVSRASTKNQESKGGSQHLLRLRLVTASEDIVPYSCGGQYQSKCFADKMVHNNTFTVYIHPLVNHVMIVQLEPLNVVDTFRGFLVCAYSKTTHDRTHAGAFLQPTTTANWKTTTCYSTNVSQLVYDSSLHRNLGATLYPTGLCY